ncbi:hypothetical protein [Actinorugispora endophytica]|uniref:DUF8129 domain-containing protein n=1 Tax=Actinorugispora endophytica TaxID=1605990 RepID=A0A4R6V6S6_9ACTN|nr:hypothetical protein [Actinorugispora endophytica]TDQ54799.1 hypothetical protein EV190_101115 [Actinorugispora endophytica]
MSKPSIASKLTGAFKRVFGKTTRPVASSKPEDMAAGDAVVHDPDAPTETTPADASAADAAGEFATEAASAQEQQPLETPASPEAAEAVRTEPVETSETAAEEPVQDEADLVRPEEKAEIAETLNVAEAETVAAPTKAFVEARAAAEGGSSPEGGAPPLPNYDTLTLPSVRARLRKLTIEQVRELRAYESANANRPEFVRMYDNRVAKLEAEAAE